MTLSKLNERREQARSAKRELSKNASIRSKSSGKSGRSSTKSPSRKAKLVGQTALSKSQKDLEKKLIQEQPDLTQ